MAGVSPGTLMTPTDPTEQSAVRPADVAEPVDTGIFGLDVGGQCSFVNDAASRLLGWGLSELLGEDVHERTHPFDKAGTVASRQKCPVCTTPRTGLGVRVEDATFRRRDGTPLEVEYQTYPISANGSVIGAIVTFVDVAGRRQLRDTVRRQRRVMQVYKEVAEAANRARTVEDATSTALRLLCDATEWQIGHLVVIDEEGLRSTSVSFPAGSVHPDADNGGPLSARVLQRGEPVWISDLEEDPDVSAWAARALPGARAAAAFPVHSDRHVTSVLEFFSRVPVPREEPVLELMTHVGTQLGQVAERQATEARLRAAQHAADDASLAKSRFLARMSHELRTPLSALLGFTELLEMETLPAVAREYSAAIMNAGNHLLSLINDVLDIARIEAGKLSLSIESVSARELLTECRELMHPLASARGISLHVRTSGPEVFMLADHQRLKQVVVNLVANAVKYNRNRGSVTMQVRDVGKGRVRLEVKDTGYGIAARDIEKLFAPFERLNANSTAVEGTGLGLALSRHLTEVMGGSMGVHSAVDVGSTFWIEFPRAAPVAGIVEDPAAESIDVSPPRPRRSVLYVEDTLSNIQLMERILERRPHIELMTAMEGRQAVDLAREHQPDLVLLDLHLPDIEGAEVLRQLQHDPRTRHIPVVVVSADATQRQIDRLLAGGAADYLTKPLSVRRFLEVLDEHLATVGERPPPII